MIYTAKREDTGELVDYEDDPDQVVAWGEVVLLPLDGKKVRCTRVPQRTQVLATDRRKRFDERYMAVRTDGRLSTMQFPTQAQVRAAGLPEAPYYNANGEASFMTRDQASDYAKRFSDADPNHTYEFGK